MKPGILPHVNTRTRRLQGRRYCEISHTLLPTYFFIFCIGRPSDEPEIGPGHRPEGPSLVASIA